MIYLNLQQYEHEITALYLCYLNMSHLDRLQGKMSPWDSDDPLDKCSLSPHQRAWLTLPLLSSNTLKPGDAHIQTNALVVL